MRLLPSPSSPRLLTLLYVISTLAVRLLLANNNLPSASASADSAVTVAASASASASTTARQLPPPPSPPHNQRTRSSQVDTDSLPMVLLSIQENLHDISQRQKQDFSLLRVASDMDVISHRLKNVEEQIARAESYNKMRFEQLIESTMKSEFLIDQLTRRVEKSFQRIVDRLSAARAGAGAGANSFAERTNDIHQANLDKVKPHDYATTRWTRLGFSNSIITETETETETAASRMRIDPSYPTSPHSDPAPTPAPPASASAYANVSAAATTTTTTTTQSSSTVGDFNQQRRRHDASVPTLKYVTNGSHSDILKASNDSSSPQTVSSPVSDQQLLGLSDVQQFVENQADRVLSAMDEKHSRLERQMAFLKSSYEECVNLADEVYLKLSDKRFDATNYFDNVLESLVAQINSHNLQNVRTLEMSVKNNMDAVLNLQRAFADNCRRLQLNEDQIEDKVIAVLQSLVDYFDNRTQLAQRRRFLDRNYLIRELTERNSYPAPAPAPAPAAAETESETETETDIVETEADQTQPIVNTEQSRDSDTATHKMQLDEDDQSCREMTRPSVALISPSAGNASSVSDSKNVSKVIFVPKTGLLPTGGDTPAAAAAAAELKACADDSGGKTTQRDQSGLVLVDLYGATSTTDSKWDSETEFDKNQLSDREPVQDFSSSSEHENGFDVADDPDN
ncbi:uncharacterized protein LOC135838142 isoform X2 [Planococcus citri]|uniref:uncharacterized protein LOC135838142 isoform X2 n=1 Tax=Planococcus citri TaxID=170843 RepID=UPI0031F954B0